MLGKMRAALNQFFTRRHEDEEAKLSEQIWKLLETNNDLLFLGLLNFYVCFLRGLP